MKSLALPLALVSALAVASGNEGKYLKSTVRIYQNEDAQNPCLLRCLRILSSSFAIRAHSARQSGTCMTSVKLRQSYSREEALVSLEAAVVSLRWLFSE